MKFMLSTNIPGNHYYNIKKNGQALRSGIPRTINKIITLKSKVPHNFDAY